MRPHLLFLLLFAFACTPLHMKPEEDAPDVADAYFASKRSGTADPQAAYARARRQMSGMRRYSTQSDALRVAPPASAAPGPRATAQESAGAGGPALAPWTFLGPGNIGGRTRTLIIDPQNRELFYAGGVSGGVWKSVNGGGSWTPTGDAMVNMAVNSMAMDPRDNRVIYAGTGEGYFREEVRGTGLPLRGDGIFVTRDAGATWQQLPSTASNPDFQWVNDLAISVHDSARIYAATRSGVWRSDDRGATWSHSLATVVKGGCFHLAMRNDTDGDYFFASCGTLDQATVYRNTDARANGSWTPVLSEPDQGLTSIAIAPSRPSTVYALAANNGPGTTNQGLLAVFRSDQSGDPGTWRARVRFTDPNRINSLLLTNLLGGSASQCGFGEDSYTTMGWYCNTIAVDPVDPERVFAGGVDLFRSDDGGRNWGVASYWWSDAATDRSSLHADQHKLLFDPRYDGTTNQTLYAANDGGVFRTDNARAPVGTAPDAPCRPGASQMAFTSLSHDYGVTQFYHGAVFPDGRRLIGGTQDNATLVGRADDPNGWSTRIGGDGGYVAIDPADPRYVYAEFYNANIFRSNDGGATFPAQASGGLSDAFLFVTPFVLDPNETTRLWTGGRRMWRTDNRGSRWVMASMPFPGQISAIAVAPGLGDRVLAGTTAGDIHASSFATTTTNTTTWKSVRPRQGWVSSLTFDPVDAGVVYATYAGFGGAHVWKSGDGGTTWASIDGAADAAIPDIPVHSIAVDPSRRNRLYLGTDLGVFVSLDGGERWNVENTGFAPVVTETVVIAPGARGPAIYAFTHGRGVWRAELAPATRRRSAPH